MSRNVRTRKETGRIARRGDLLAARNGCRSIPTSELPEATEPRKVYLNTQGGREPTEEELQTFVDAILGE